MNIVEVGTDGCFGGIGLMIKRYVPNPNVSIEAMLITGANVAEGKKWAGDDLRQDGLKPPGWEVHTLEGWVQIPFGHYLIRGTHGEFYPCAPEVFENRWVEAG